MLPFPTTSRAVDQALAWLLTYAVHSTLLLGVAWAVSRRLGGRRLRLQETIWRCALVGALVTTTAQLALGGLGHAPIAGRWIFSSAAAAPAAPTAPAATGAGAGMAGRTRTAARSGAIRVGMAAAVVAGPGRAGLPAGADAMGGARALAMVLLPAWLLGALALTLGHLRAHRLLRRQLRCRLRVVGGGVLARLAGLARESGMSRRVRLTCTWRLRVPVALAGRGAEVCVPPRALFELSDERQDALLAHELAHLARRDTLWLPLTGLLVGVLFFQPLNWLARRRLRELSELLCDEWAVARTGRPLSLAGCLAEVAGWSLAALGAKGAHGAAARHASLPVPGMADRPSQLAHRIRRLLDGSSREEPGPAGHRVALLVAVGLLAVILAAPGISAGPSQAASKAAAAAPAAASEPAADPAPASAEVSSQELEPSALTPVSAPAPAATAAASAPAPAASPNPAAAQMTIGSPILSGGPGGEYVQPGFVADGFVIGSPILSGGPGGEVILAGPGVPLLADDRAAAASAATPDLEAERERLAATAARLGQLDKLSALSKEQIEAMTAAAERISHEIDGRLTKALQQLDRQLAAARAAALPHKPAGTAPGAGTGASGRSELPAAELDAELAGLAARLHPSAAEMAQLDAELRKLDVARPHLSAAEIENIRQEVRHELEQLPKLGLDQAELDHVRAEVERTLEQLPKLGLTKAEIDELRADLERTVKESAAAGAHALSRADREKIVADARRLAEQLRPDQAQLEALRGLEREREQLTRSLAAERAEIEAMRREILQQTEALREQARRLSESHRAHPRPSPNHHPRPAPSPSHAAPGAQATPTAPAPPASGAAAPVSPAPPAPPAAAAPSEPPPARR